MSLLQNAKKRTHSQANAADDAGENLDKELPAKKQRIAMGEILDGVARLVPGDSVPPEWCQHKVDGPLRTDVPSLKEATYWFDTVEQNTDEWHVGRKGGLSEGLKRLVKGTIGASGRSKMLGYSKYESTMDFFLLKIGVLPPKPFDDTYAMDHGHAYEDEALRFYELVCRPKAAAAAEGTQPLIAYDKGLCLHGFHTRPRAGSLSRDSLSNFAIHPELSASVDALVDAGDAVTWNKHCAGDLRWGLAEVKCPQYGVYRTRDTNVPHTIPVTYMIQMQAQMDCMRPYLLEKNGLDPDSPDEVARDLWCDFVVHWRHHERVGPKRDLDGAVTYAHMLVTRVYLNPVLARKINEGCLAFQACVNERRVPSSRRVELEEPIRAVVMKEAWLRERRRSVFSTTSERVVECNTFNNLHPIDITLDDLKAFE